MSTKISSSLVPAPRVVRSEAQGMSLPGTRGSNRDLLRQLADLVDEPTAGTLEGALDAGRATVALTVEDRERILRAPEDCPEGLAELRRVLLREHEWRRCEGL